jgi:predicted kinase
MVGMGIIKKFMNLLEILTKRKILNEGIEDPSILKCIFFAGGPASGKSRVAGNIFNIPKDLPLSSYGLKLINSDHEFEFLLKKSNISLNLSKLSSDEFKKLTVGPDSLRSKARNLTAKKLELYKQSKLGLIMDGTGHSIENIQIRKRSLELIGYDCFMIFVNTSLEVALERNRNRQRVLPDDLVKQMWHSCQQNIGHYQNLFDNNFKIVDNSKIEEIHKSVIKSVIEFLKSPVKNPIGKRWMENYYSLHSSTDNTNDSFEDDNDDYDNLYPTEKPKQKLKNK